MLKTLLFLIAFISLLFQAKAQTGSITGKVVSEKKQPAEFVNVLLQRTSDSTLVQANLTTAVGRYEFTNLVPGSYRVAVVGLGYEKAYSEPLTIAAVAVEVPVISLLVSTQKLSEVTVTASRAFLEQQPDKLVVNVAGSIVAAGSTVLEVLRKVPGVQVRNEQVTIAGKASVSIMIDGKPSPYTDMNALIRDLPSGSIDRIEVISNPSAKYDAAGGAVINIIMKPNANLGTNAALALSLGDGRYNQREVGRGTQDYFRINPTLSINHRQGRWNVFGSYGLMRRRTFDITLLDRYVADIHYVQRNYNPEQYTMHTYRAGVDYVVNAKNTIGILIQGFDRNGEGAIYNTTELLRLPSESAYDSFTSVNEQRTTRQNQAVNLNWKHAYDSVGTALNVDLDLAHYNLRNSSIITTTPRTGAPVVNEQLVVNPVNFATIKVDYVRPLSHGRKLEAGLKLSDATIDSDLTFKRQGLFDPNSSNHFRYQENINAAYVMFYQKTRNWNLQAGIRGEQTTALGRLDGDLIVNRKYWQPFPSVFVTRRIDTTLAITAQYSRRIDRPSYQQQNPFIYYLDSLTYTKGNPALRPQFTNSYKLGLTYAGQPVFQVSYDRTADVIFDYAPQQETVQTAYGPVTKTFTVADNLARAENFSSSLNFPISLQKIVDGYGGIQLNYQKYDALYQGELFRRSKWNWIFSTEVNFRLTASTKAQISGYYATASQYEFFQAGYNSSFGAGIEQRLWQGRGKLTLNVNDVFYDDRIRGRIEFGDINFRIQTPSETRNVKLTLSYALGNRELKSVRERSTGAEAESQRVRVK